ncbi:MAG TPA: hypothetical protein VMM79_05705 [Longimicrobiales bacterium]|nr:hypothetical protein [Longimicrobiales bacterium]
MPETVDRVKLVFADRGSFHDMLIDVPSDAVQQYGRLIDALREDPRIAAGIYIDFRRLVAARLVTGEESD